MKLLGISSVDFDVISQLQVRYFVCIGDVNLYGDNK
jgi:hypothetical protein